MGITLRTTYVPLMALLIFSFSVFAAQGDKQADKDVRKLNAGTPIERELNGGGEHLYEIQLTEGEYLDFLVEQKAIDVAVAVIGPDGQVVFEKNTPIGAFGRERLLFFADTSGTFRIRVRSVIKNSNSGRYLIRINELHPATEAERSLAEGEMVMGKASRQRGQERLETVQKAIETLGRARKSFGEAQNKNGEARALFLTGRAQNWLGDYRKAIQFLNQALHLYRELGDRTMQVETLDWIGKNHMNLDEGEKMVEHFLQALELLRSIGNRAEQGGINIMIGLAYGSRQPYKALEFYHQALEILREFGDKDGQAAVLNNAASIYLVLNDNEKALDYFLQALTFSTRNPIILNHIGIIYGRMGENDKALDYHNRALAITRENGDSFAEANSLEELGTIHARLGNRVKGLELLNQAVSLRLGFKDPRKGASPLAKIGMIYADMGEFPKAMEYFKQVLDVYREIGLGQSVAGVLFQIAKVQRQLGNLQEARVSIEEAINLVESLRTTVTGQTLRSLYFATVHHYYEFQIDLLMRLHAQYPSERLDIAALDHSERARSRSMIDLLAESGTDLQKRIEPKLLEREASIRQSLNAKAEEQMRLLGQTHAPERTTSIEREIRALEIQYQQVEGEIQKSSSEYAALSKPVALHRIQTTEMGGTQSNGDKGRPQIVSALTLKELQNQVLDADTLLLEYSLGDERSYLWAVSQASITSFVLPRRADIEAAARRVYESLTAPNQAPKGETPEQQLSRLARAESDNKDAAAALSRMILAPASTHLGNKRLVIVADGALQYIPFSSLPAPSGKAEPLIVNHEITYTPSASALAALRRALVGRTPGAKPVAVLADPVFSRDDPRLEPMNKSSQPPATEGSITRDLERAIKDTGQIGGGLRIPRLLYSRREAEAIVAAAPPGSSLKALDFDASRATATGSDIGQYRIVHFATHGLLNSQHPELSGIVLSLFNRQGEPQNGFLRLHDLFNLKLPADLVVLSACQTALGKEIQGEGLVGLTRGFMYAGAARVMASLWKVDDAATAELMKRFYGKVLKTKMRPAAALREAQIEMWQQKRWHSPYNWSAFTLQGDWR